MAMFTKQNGVWRDMTKAYRKVNGAWIPVRTVYMNGSGVWRDVSTPPFSWADALALGGNTLDVTQYALEIDDGLLVAPFVPNINDTMYVTGASAFSVSVVLQRGRYEVMGVGGGSAGNTYSATASAFRTPGRYQNQTLSFSAADSVVGGIGGSAAQLVEDSFTVDVEGVYVLTPALGGTSASTEAQTGGTTSIVCQATSENVFTAAGATVRPNTYDPTIPGCGCRLTRPNNEYQVENGTFGLAHVGIGGSFKQAGACSFNVFSTTPRQTQVTSALIGGGGGEGSYFPYGAGIVAGNGTYTNALRMSQANCGETGHGYGAGGGGGGRYNASYSIGEPGAPGAIFIRKVA